MKLLPIEFCNTDSFLNDLSNDSFLTISKAKTTVKEPTKMSNSIKFNGSCIEGTQSSFRSSSITKCDAIVGLTDLEYQSSNLTFEKAVGMFNFQNFFLEDVGYSKKAEDQCNVSGDYSGTIMNAGTGSDPTQGEMENNYGMLDLVKDKRTILGPDRDPKGFR